ncbi:hypothetical protein BK010_06260 [Tenericutes bacterium MO-XQ]|nr:hypothetical protein BK010_06260 [Tenericutes bacterium MO-XQ]
MKYKRRLHKDFIEVNNTETLNVMLNDCANFFDSIIVDIQYTSGSSRSNDNRLYPFDDLAELQIVIESQIENGMKIILLFENITQFNLVPSDLYYDSLLGKPFVYIDSEILFSFIYPREQINEDTSKNNTWVKSRFLKYKIIKH